MLKESQECDLNGHLKGVMRSYLRASLKANSIRPSERVI